ncbi:MAG: diaminopimelate epimerase [Lentisphaeria bacterium]|nr:diaminopimelate epimerase [Lentisphaeria bacterium]
MQSFHFDKMQGAGNDFVVTHDAAVPRECDAVAKICDRKYGIGSDGLIVLSQADEKIRFEFWNPDGAKAEMCGNGLRCAMEYASYHGLTQSGEAVFLTDSGVLTAERLYPGMIRIRMPDASEPVMKTVSGYDCFVTKVGVPHAVVEVKDLENLDVKKAGSKLRYAEGFAPEGTNIDFVEVLDSDHLKIRTYERGVEDETLACGTGVTASAIFLMKNENGSKKKYIFCRSGDEIVVEFPENGNILKEIYLTGPAVTVFSGTYNF